MGCKIDCCQPATPDKQISHINANYQEDDTQQLQKQLTQRKGQPSQNIAISLDQLLAKISQQQRIQFQKQIYTIRQHQKNHIKALKLDRTKSQHNQLSDPYYLPHIKSFYIGQWVYHKKYKQNFPKGIGRLYTNQWIYQGVIQTFIIPIIKLQKNLENSDIFEQRIMQDKKKSIISSSNSLDNQVYFIKLNKIDLQTSRLKYGHFKVLINGMGRKLNRKQEFQGKFIEGVLHGKGTYKNYDLNYQYCGLWENGVRHGKGIQKSKNFIYDGSFQNDKKQGQGILTFFLDKDREHQIQAQNKMVKQKSSQDVCMIQQEIKLQMKRKKRLEQLIAIKLKQYQWKNPFYKMYCSSNFQSQDFYLQKQLKKVFPEKYSGLFSNNQMQGIGIYQWYNGKVFNGQWKSGQIEGVGQFYWPDGAIYRGQYKNDLKHGKGEMIWCQKRRFRGSWAFGVRHGYGQSIQIMNGMIKIKGALWKKDKQEKIYFENFIDFPEYDEEVIIESSQKQIDENIFDLTTKIFQTNKQIGKIRQQI